MIFTVEAASKKRDVTKEGMAPAVVYNLTLTTGNPADGPMDAEWFTPATSPMPQVGEKIDGDVGPGKFGGLSFTKAKANGYRGNTGGGYKPKSPAETAAIAASVALKEAVPMVEQAATFGLIGKPESLEAHVGLLKRYADWCFAYIEAKSKAAV